MARQRTGHSDEDRSAISANGWLGGRVRRSYRPIIVVCVLLFAGAKLWFVTQYAGKGHELRTEQLTERRQQQLREATAEVESKLDEVRDVLEGLETSVTAGEADGEIFEAVVTERPEMLSAGRLDDEARVGHVTDAGAHHTHLLELAARRSIEADERVGTAGGITGAGDRVLRAFVRHQETERPGAFVGVVVDMRDIVDPIGDVQAQTGVDWIVRDPEGRTDPLSTVRLSADSRRVGAGGAPELLERMEAEASGTVPIERSTARRLDVSGSVRRLHVERVEMTSAIDWSIAMIRPPLPTRTLR